MLRLITTAFAAAFVLAATGLASAADMPKKAGDPSNAFASAQTWGGFYIGGAVGYAFGEVKTDDFKVKPDGFVGGGFAGINHQYGQVVAGIEVDLTLMNIKDRWTETGCRMCDSVASKYDMIATARARVGLTAFGPNTLVYATGGIAWARGTVDEATTGIPIIGTISDSFGFNNTGWTVGGGFEVLLSPHWAWRTQYLYIDLGKTGDAKNIVNLATTGLSFRF